MASAQNHPSHLGNAIWNVLEVILYPVLLILLTPYYINQLGVELYGVLVLINALVMSFNLINFGINETTIKYLSAFQANKPTESQRLINTASLLAIVSVFICGITALMFFLLKAPLLQLLNFDNTELYLQLIPLSVFIVGLRAYEQFLISTCKGMNRFDLSSKISMMVKTSLILSGAVVLFLGYGLMEVWVVYLLLLLIIIPIEALVISRILDINFLPKYDRQTFMEFRSFTLWNWTQNLSVTLFTQVDKYLVAGLADLATVTYYSLGSMIYNQVHTVSAASANWLVPTISQKAELHGVVQDIYKKVQAIIVPLITVGCVILLVIGPIIFPIWLGEEVYSESAFFLDAFICLEAIMGLTILPYIFFIATGHIKTNTSLEISFKVANISFMILGYYLLGLKGMVYGLMLSAIIFIPIQQLQLHKTVFRSNTYNGLYPFQLLTPALLLLLFNTFLPSSYSLLMGLACFVLLALVFRGDFNANALINQIKRKRVD